MAQKLTHRIRQHIEITKPGLLGQTYSGGLSSREGLAALIHDGYGESSPIDDKRLWVIESEFSNVLHQTKRDGNTLSAALRDAWDGADIKPATKVRRIGVTEPHIGIHANITDSELLNLLTSREMGNGFANRFLFVWSENIGCEPFPEPTSDSVIEQLADATREIIGFAKGRYPQSTNSQKMHLSAAAKAYYAAIYPTLRRPLANEFLNRFVDRRLPYVLRLAALFALTDQTLVVETQHIKAALAWVNYATDTVKFVFHERANVSASAETAAYCRKILVFLAEKPAGCTKTDITRDCFGGNTAETKIQEALKQLLSDNPPQIEILTPETAGRGRRAKVYRLKHSTKETKEFGNEERRGFEGNFEPENATKELRKNSKTSKV